MNWQSNRDWKVIDATHTGDVRLTFEIRLRKPLNWDEIQKSLPTEEASSYAYLHRWEGDDNWSEPIGFNGLLPPEEDGIEIVYIAEFGGGELSPRVSKRLGDPATLALRWDGQGIAFAKSVGIVLITPFGQRIETGEIPLELFELP